MRYDATQFSLADFFFSDTDDPLKVSPDYLSWRKETAWATSLYEPLLGEAAGARGTIHAAAGPQQVINMTSFGYLGLVRHPRIIAAAKAALDLYGTGACGSPILSGKSLKHRELEEKLAALTGRDGVLVYNSGFGGALGSVSGLLRKGDVAVLDARAHVSLIDGAKTSGATIVFFEHNHPGSLDQVLASHPGRRRLVVVDGIYSMDGDLADLPRLLDVAESHRVGLFVDEAHSIFCCGATGGGVVEHFGVNARVGVQYGTFSKGFSAAGGFAAASPEIIDYLRFYANPYGFTCALPPAVVAGLCEAFDVMKDEPWRRERLWANAAYFRKGLTGMGINIGRSQSYVVPIVVGAERGLLYEMGHTLRNHGLFVTPVDYPTVPLDQSRFRASITAEHSREDLDRALQILQDVFVPAMRTRGLLQSA